MDGGGGGGDVDEDGVTIDGVDVCGPSGRDVGGDRERNLCSLRPNLYSIMFRCEVIHCYNTACLTIG